MFLSAIITIITGTLTFDTASRATVVEPRMPRRIRLEPHLTDDQLEARYRRPRDPVASVLARPIICISPEITIASPDCPLWMSSGMLRMVSFRRLMVASGRAYRSADSHQVPA